MEVRELEGVPEAEARFGTALCAAHGAPAVESCERCGAFVCAGCAVPGEAGLKCEACAARPPDGASPPLPGSPWKTMWLHPKRGLRHALGQPRPLRDALGVVLTTGVAWGAFVFAVGLLGTPAQGVGRLLVALLTLLAGAALAQLLTVAVAASLVRPMGAWVGGRGRFGEVFAALAWSELPLLLHFGLLAALTVAMPERSPVPPAGVLLLYGTPVAALWHLGVTILAVAEAHRFGPGRAVVALLLPLVLPAVVAALAVLLFVLVFPVV